MNNYLKIALLFVLVNSVLSNEDVPEVKDDEGVLVLNEKNFDYVLSNNKYVLVEFYAPWCGHCKALAPEYVKAAASLKEAESEAILAKVDATAEKSLGTKFEVRGYPTLKFFVSGKPSEYQGGRQAPDIVNWLKKKTGPPCKVLNTADEVTAFKDGNEVAVIGYFENKDTSEAQNYDVVANQIDDVPFGVIFDSAVASAVEVSLNAVTLFKQTGDGKFEKKASMLWDYKLGPWIMRETSPLLQEFNDLFDEGRMDYDGELSDVAALSAFIKNNQLRLFTEFTSETAPKIFGGEIQIHNLLFVSKKSEDFDKHHQTFTDVASEYKGKVLFVYIDTDVEDNQRVMEFFGLTEADIPDYRIIKMSENMAKFKPDTKDLSKDAVSAFTSGVVSGDVKRHLMSQEIPEDWNTNPVSVLVGKNFREVAFDESKKVFVEFYAPWCGHCKSLKPTWEKLGEAFKDEDDVVIAMMDSTANEVSEFEVSGFPTLKFFPSGTDKILDYSGDRTVDAMVEYVKSNGEKVSGGDGGEDEEDIDEEDMDDYEDEGEEEGDDEAPRDEL